ncbi:PREDICTED: conserved oligomeric Golgi complex subunit 4 [Ceratosolen solmsi marchali]|uniref:Conserved oligomeric Golgi complex subunit 4 n=1 Tax=Ceratosolen solmsi marchali TaxID=326594 RepID=A0AAJ7E363_9HYME|nr:PREDICTED: conserved oligomeric Golgi complex subunit 4 [Ceratosolen solmsi marchali]
MNMVEDTPPKEENLMTVIDKLQEDDIAVNKHLDHILSKHCHVEAKLQSISKILPNIAIVRLEAEKFQNVIGHTNNLAEKVSAKVRQLDLARSRVCECQSRVNDILDLQLCSDGVATALRNEDYEQGAAHVHRFLLMDQQLLERTADNVSGDHTSVTSSLANLQQAANELRAVITHKFDEAVKSEDLASIERFFKVFPLLGMHNDGITKFCHYLCSKLQETAQKNLKAALDVRSTDKRSAVIFADTITMLFEGIARIIEVHQPIVETYYGPGKLLSCIGILQKECDKQIKKVISEFTKHRKIAKRVQLINEYLRKQGGTERVDPKDLDLVLSEITIMHIRAELYIKFLRRRIINDLEISTTDTQQRKDLLNDFEMIIKNSELACSMQELLGAYLAVEKYFMEESVNKAIGMDALDQDQQTSSMVDDAFFIVKKCIRRAISSGSIDGVCAVINMACGFLESDFTNQLRNRLRQGYPAGYLDLAQAYNALQTSIQHGRIQTSDTELARLMFLAYLNNTEVSIEYVETLNKSLSIDIDQAFQNMQTKEKGKIESCLAGMKNVALTLRTVVDYGLEQLRVSTVKPRITPWIDAFLAINHQINDDELLRYETDEPFVQSLVTNLEGFLQGFKNSLTEPNYNALIGILTAEVAARLEKVILKSTFNRNGGLILDKEIRSLASYLASATSWSVRDKFARLMQITTILSVEKIEELADYCEDSIAWRLTPAEVRKILTLRTDFRQEDIKRLKI